MPDLSPEIQSHIVSALAPQAGARPFSPSSAVTTATLRALCLTSRALQRDAERRLYASLYLASPRQAHLVCRTLAANRRLGSLVQAFWFSDEAQHGRLGRSFWQGIRSALVAMPSLERLCLFDGDLQNSWVLDCEFPFRLREAKLHFAWDTHLVAFLAAQPSLHTLQCLDPPTQDLPAAPARPLPPASLPALDRFDGNLRIASTILLLAPPLTNLQAAVDDPARPHVLRFLRSLHTVTHTLRALSVLELPDALAADTLDILAGLCPNLVYLGLIPLPPIAVRPLLPPLRSCNDSDTFAFFLFLFFKQQAPRRVRADDAPPPSAHRPVRPHVVVTPS